MSSNFVILLIEMMHYVNLIKHNWIVNLTIETFRCLKKTKSDTDLKVGLYLGKGVPHGYDY